MDRSWLAVHIVSHFEQANGTDSWQTADSHDDCLLSSAFLLAPLQRSQPLPQVLNLSKEKQDEAPLRIPRVSEISASRRRRR